MLLITNRVPPGLRDAPLVSAGYRGFLPPGAPKDWFAALSSRPLHRPSPAYPSSDAAIFKETSERTSTRTVASVKPLPLKKFSRGVPSVLRHTAERKSTPFRGIHWAPAVASVSVAPCTLFQSHDPPLPRIVSLNRKQVPDSAITNKEIEIPPSPNLGWRVQPSPPHVVALRNVFIRT